MIIQCRQCRTKYSFDDVLMRRDGIWVRCSRCQHVFFHDNPNAVKKSGEASLNLRSDFKQDAASAQIDDEAYYETRLNSGKDADVIQFLDNIMDEKNKYSQEMDGMTDSGEELDQTIPAETKGFWKAWKIALWSIFVILILPAVIYFFIFPQYGGRFVKIANMYFGTPEPQRKDVVTGQVKLQDIRQRILINYILGQIRIVEGTAVNQADYPISRIVIKGENVDAYAVILGERASFAGNILTEEELTTLSEEEILRILAQPSGRNNTNDKIPPNGHIPFMIVFAHDPPGQITTKLMTIGAERLL
jgi:predicted Zn finger-like uncharacterized protein